MLCDNKMPIQIKEKVYKSMIRPVMMYMYGAETWTLTRKEEELLERAKMRMLRWILGVSLRDRRRNEDIREVLGVASITDKAEHVLRKIHHCTFGRKISGRPF